MITAIVVGIEASRAQRQTVPARPTLTMSGVATLPARRASPLLDDDSLPVPPTQRKPVLPPSGDLPDVFVTATSALFDAGMADPRDCEYREIEIGTGSVWSGDNGIVRTHGWVLPGDGARRAAVCWNGLVYRVVSVGKAADWRADVDVLIRNATDDNSLSRPEEATVSWETYDPVKGCLVLRLGDAKLAGKFWKATQLARHQTDVRLWEREDANSRGPKPQFVPDTKDPYLVWAACWLWSLYDRAVCAHMRGDDRLALLSARGVELARPLIEREAERRGMERHLSSDQKYKAKAVPYLGFVDPVRALFKDQMRRASAPKQRAAIEIVNDPLSTQPQRIEALIRDLDQVAARQGGQPVGPFAVEDDPIVAALIREGEPAIEPLLQVLESDVVSHLTRTVTFSRDFHADRHLHTLLTPARVALLALMKTTAEATGITSKDRYEGKLSAKDEAARLREWWQRYGKMSEAERWYRTLADDTAGKDAWTDAAWHLTLRGADGRYAGEPLRGKSNPSVSELLVKRAEGFVRVRRKWRSSFDGFHDADASRFILKGMRWEGPPLLVIARELMTSIAGYTAPGSKQGERSRSDGRIMAELAVGCAAHGEMGALDQWSQWILGCTPDDLGSYPDDSLEPFWRHSDHPAVAAAARKLFGDPTSPWALWLMPDTPRSPLGDQTCFALLVLPEIRDRWQEGLGARLVIGTILLEQDGGTEIEIPRVRWMRWGPRTSWKGVPPGTKATIRRCDLAAEFLSRIHGFSEFSFFWTESHRDQVIATMKELLVSKGAHLRVFVPELRFNQVPGIRFEFPKRDRPATAADVVRGDAIFHLDDQSGVEAVVLPSVPMLARMKNMEHEEVLVWQAEQIHAQGQARRYYGVVGTHKIGRVSADEIEFVSEAKEP